MEPQARPSQATARPLVIDLLGVASQTKYDGHDDLFSVMWQWSREHRTATDARHPVKAQWDLTDAHLHASDEAAAWFCQIQVQTDDARIAEHGLQLGSVLQALAESLPPAMQFDLHGIQLVVPPLPGVDAPPVRARNTLEEVAGPIGEGRGSLVWATAELRAGTSLGPVTLPTPGALVDGLTAAGVPARLPTDATPLPNPRVIPQLWNGPGCVRMTIQVALNRWNFTSVTHAIERILRTAADSGVNAALVVTLMRA